MSATDDVRRLLDERGVEWWEATPCKTKWNSPIIGGPVAAREWNGEMVLDTGYIAVTPEQAVEATLGRGTCRMNESGLPVFNGHDDGYFSICSECGFVNYMRRAWLPIKFCPSCGRRIEVTE